MTKNRAMIAAGAVALGSVTVVGGSLLAGFGLNRDAAASAVAASVTAAVAAGEWKVDASHSGVNFVVTHGGDISQFHGRFDEIEGTFTFDPASPESGSFNFSVPTKSVNTNNEKRDDHLRNADFFNARQFPNLTFTSTAIAAGTEPKQFVLTGDLGLHGQTKPITATLTWHGTGEFNGNAVAGFTAVFTIKRSEFGMTKYAGGIGDEVTITVWVEANPA